ncbi:MAG: antA/AntB antirepressor family protein [Lutibacter sp.]|jgi:phage anti-repressor protein
MNNFPQQDNNGFFNAKDIYAFVEVKTPFNDWIRRCIEYADLSEDKDFYTNLRESIGGRRGTDYFFNSDATKEICIVSATNKAKELRRWLINLSNNRESGLLLNRQEFMNIFRMVKIFSIYEYRAMALEKNSSNYIKNAILINPKFYNKDVLYSKFHIWRNEVLQTGKEVLKERLKEYCLIERKRIPAKFSQDEALTLLGEYEQIRNAVWDLLSSQNKSEELIKNICDLSQDIAREIKPFLERLNQSNLFFKKIEEKEIKSIGLI